MVLEFLFPDSHQLMTPFSSILVGHICADDRSGFIQPFVSSTSMDSAIRLVDPPLNHLRGFVVRLVPFSQFLKANYLSTNDKFNPHPFISIFSCHAWTNNRLDFKASLTFPWSTSHQLWIHATVMNNPKSMSRLIHIQMNCAEWLPSAQYFCRHSTTRLQASLTRISASHLVPSPTRLMPGHR